MRFLTAASLLATALLTRPAHADNTQRDGALSPSNLDLMTKLGTEVVEEIVGGIESQVAVQGVRLKPLAAAEYYRFLDNIFTKIMKERGIKIYGPPGQPGQGAENMEAANPLILEYEALEFRLSYERIYRSFLIGGKRVQRRADLKVLAKLVRDKNSEIMWIGEKEAGQSDQFSFGDVGRVESGAFQFTKPARPSTGWGKLVEPVFVSGIIVGMIYLFFSNQSDS